MAFKFFMTFLILFFATSLFVLKEGDSIKVKYDNLYDILYKTILFEFVAVTISLIAMAWGL